MDLFTKIEGDEIHFDDINVKKLMDELPIGLVIASTEGIVHYTNKYYQKMIGYSKEELLGMSFTKITHPEDLHKNKELLVESLSNLSTVKFQKRYIRNDGKELHVRFILTTIFNDSLKEKFFLGMVEDISYLYDFKYKLEVKEIEDIRSQRMEAISKITGLLAHTFNNELNIVMGYLELLKEQSAASNQFGDQIISYITEIEKAVNRSSALSTQLLDLADNKSTEMKAHDLSRVVRSTLPMIMKLIPDNIEFVKEIEPDCVVSCDASFVQQIVLNLILFCISSIEESGTIELKLFKNDHTIYDLREYAIISIGHDGKSLPENLLPYIFEPILHEDDTETPNFELSSAYGLTLAMNGKIEFLKRPSTDQRDRFEIYFPSFKKLDQGDTKTQGTRETPSKEVRLILIDDNVHLTKMFEVYFSKKFPVIIYNDPLKFDLNTIKPSDIVICDVKMPHLGGEELAQRIRNFHSNLPIFLISGYSPRELSEILQDPNTIFIPKPFKMKEMEKRIEEFVSLN